MHQEIFVEGLHNPAIGFVLISGPGYSPHLYHKPLRKLVHFVCELLVFGSGAGGEEGYNHFPKCCVPGDAGMVNTADLLSLSFK